MFKLRPLIFIILVLTHSLQSMTPDFAIEGAAGDFQAPGGVVFVQVGFMKDPENQSALRVRQGSGDRFIFVFPEKTGQMPAAEDVVLGNDHRVVDGIFQLTDIARPIIIHQGLHGVGRKPLDIFFLLGVAFTQEMAAQQGNIIFPFPESGEMDGDDV